MIRGANEVERKVCRGCPQGSVCGPAVWNMMMDGLLEEIGRRGISCVVYADDLLCMIEADNRTETVMMLLKGSLSDSRPPNVRIQDKRLKYVKEVKYLGTRVSERMNFSPQVESLEGRMIGLMGKLRRVLRKERNLDKRTVRVIYKRLVVACASFGVMC